MAEPNILTPIIVSATKQKTLEDFYKNTALGFSINKLGIMHHKIFLDNSKGLSEVYNEFLDNPGNFKRVVFLHDDVFIIDSFMFEKLSKGFRKFDIIGIAGAERIEIAENPMAQKIGWHKVADKGKLSGGVLHTIYNKEKMQIDFDDQLDIAQFTWFGAYNKYVAVIDGLFIAINLEKIGNLRFDVDFPFHFYDMTFCINAIRAGLRIGVCPIIIQHQSIGLNLLSKDYDAIQKKFVEKYVLPSRRIIPIEQGDDNEPQ